MNLLMITGTSQGIGLAVARQALQVGYTVLGVSRRESLLGNESHYHHLILDLDNPEARKALMPAALKLLEGQQVERIYLLNNAGMLDPLKAVEKCSSQEIQKILNINLAAPIDLCAQFIAAFEAFKVPKKILNVSSGSALHPMPDMSLYCTSKAGLTMFSKCLALEQASLPWGVSVASLDPGMVETGMQVTARSLSPASFRPAEKFRAAKESGRVKGAGETAAKIVKILEVVEFKGEMLTVETV